MTKTDLPEGVPPDNQAKASFSGDDYRAPDMATPSFAHEGAQSDYKTTQVLHEQMVEDDDDEDDNRHPRQVVHGGVNNSLAILIAIAALFAALGAIVIANSRSDMPLCSSQPAWNQYNCRAG